MVEHDSLKAYQEKNTSASSTSQRSVLDTSHETVSTHSFSQVIFGAKHSILTDISFHSCAKQTFRRKPSHQIGLKKRKLKEVLQRDSSLKQVTKKFPAPTVGAYIFLSISFELS